MADMISKLKTAALVAGATLFVVACGEKAAEPAAEPATAEAVLTALSVPANPR